MFLLTLIRLSSVTFFYSLGSNEYRFHPKYDSIHFLWEIEGTQKRDVRQEREKGGGGGVFSLLDILRIQTHNLLTTASYSNMLKKTPIFSVYCWMHWLDYRLKLFLFFMSWMNSCTVNILCDIWKSIWNLKRRSQHIKSKLVYFSSRTWIGI